MQQLPYLGPIYPTRMKRRAALLSLVLLSLLGATSCVREYSCQCRIRYTGQPGLPDSTMREYPIRDTKDKAKDLCAANSYETTDSKSGITTKESCALY